MVVLKLLKFIKIKYIIELVTVLQTIANVVEDFADNRKPSSADIEEIAELLAGRLSTSLKTATLKEIKELAKTGVDFYYAAVALFKS